MKAGDWITMCLLKTNDCIIPAISPKTRPPKTGDLVFFEMNGVEKMADVIFIEHYAKMDDALYVGLSVATGMEPVQITKIAYVNRIDWEEAERDERMEGMD